jgi:hypothetical protein
MSKRPSTHGKIRALYIVRESNRRDDLLESKLVQTLGPDAAKDDGVAYLMSLKLDPFINPDRHGAILLPCKDDRGVQLEHEENMVLYYAGSAAALENVDDDEHAPSNTFTETLCSIIAERQPDAIVVADLDRMIRSSLVTGRLQHMIKKYVGVVRAGGLELGVRTVHFDMWWSTLATVAAADRDAVVRRLQRGRVAGVINGRWSLPGRPPEGWKVGKDGRPVVDDDDVEVVRQVIKILAVPGLNGRERRDLLVRAGYPLTRLRHGGAERRGLKGDECDWKSESYWKEIDRLYAGLPVYLDGIYERTVKNYFTDVDSVDGFVVVEKKFRGDAGRLLVRLQLPMPEGGWGAKEDIEQAIRIGNTMKSRGRAARSDMSPLSHLPSWETDGEVRWVEPEDAYLKVYSRPLVSDAEVQSGVRLNVTVKTDELFMSMSEAIATGLEHGVSARPVSGVHVTQGANGTVRSDRDSHELAALAHQLSSTDKALSGLMRSLVSPSLTDAARAAVEDELNRLTQFKAEIEAQIAVADGTASIRLPDGTEANLGFLERWAAILGEYQGRIRRQVAQGLREIVSEFRIDWTDDGMAVWSVTFLIPTPTGTLAVGPFTGAVPNRAKSARTQKAIGAAASRLSERLADQYVTSNLSRSELAAVNKCNVGYVGEALRDVFLKRGLGQAGATALSLNAPEPLRRAVWAMATGEVPTDGIDASWSAVLRRVYFETDGKWNRSWNHVQERPQQIIDELVARGGTMPWPEAMRVVPFQRLFDYTSKEKLEGKAVAVRYGTERSGSGAKGVLSLVSCTHRGCNASLTLVMCIPEVWLGFGTMLVCPACHRPAAAGAPVMPDWYFGS